MKKDKHSSKIIFSELCALTERSRSYSGLEIDKKLSSKTDKRHLSKYLQRMIDYNKHLFEFLEIEPTIEGTEKNASMWFKTGKYIGAIPLRSPDHGNPIGDFVVNPRYSNSEDRLIEYCEILTMLNEDIEPEFNDSYPLISNFSLRPPAYLDATKYIQHLSESLEPGWQHFQCSVGEFNFPKNNIEWKKYLNREYDPVKKLRFPCRVSRLSRAHKEMFELKYAFDISCNILSETTTPIKIRVSIKDKIISLNKKLANFESKSTAEIKIHGYDPPKIKNLKKQANRVLRQSGNEIVAWRIDLSLLFEKYVQYIFRRISKEIGAHQLDNTKMPLMATQTPRWGLKYLEPDIVLLKDSKYLFADAKYKSHMYNEKSASVGLKDEYRRDLHQLLAYMAFNPEKNKTGCLCYPASSFKIQKMRYVAGRWNTQQTIYLIGIPMKKEETENTVRQIAAMVSNELQRT